MFMSASLLNSIKGVRNREEVNRLQTLMPWQVTREMVTKADDVTDPSYGFTPEERPMPLRINTVMTVPFGPGPASP